MQDRTCSSIRNEHGSYASRHIMVVDDETPVVNAVSRALQGQFRCEVVTAFSGDEALLKLAEGPCDILITDMRMPGTAGLELLAQVKTAFPDTDIIVMTGLPEEFPFVEVIEAGASDFITKPHHPAELDAKIIRIFRERDLRSALAQSEQKYRSLFELSMNGLLVIERDGGTILDANAAFEELCKMEFEKLKGVELVKLLGAHDQERFEQGLALCQISGQGTIGDLTLVNAAGGLVATDVSITLLANNGRELAFLSFKDVTAKREHERKLAEAAHTDDMTGLANKRSFGAQLEGAVTHARREGSPLALLFIDLDNFKQCNDRYGHQVGDELLSVVGQLIRKSTRGTKDMGFRYGGDEFAVILPEAPVSAGQRVAGCLMADFGAAENKGTSLSIGVAGLEPQMQSASFLRAADEALYRAKANGKNQVYTVCRQTVAEDATEPAL